MTQRIVLSALLIPVLAYVIHASFLHTLLFFLFILALSILASRELYAMFLRILGEEQLKGCAVGFLLPAPLFLVCSYLRVLSWVPDWPPNGLPDVSLLCAGVIITFFLFFLPVTLRGVRRGLKRFLLLLSVFLYTGAVPYTIFSLRQESGGSGLVYVLFSLAWFSDASAYFIGSFFGRTKGIVSFSPSKSLEGYVGSFILTLALSAGLPFLFRGRFPFHFPESLGVGLLVAVLAPLGDLGESALKRRAGVKDSSRLFPAFGGVLDIFDSIFLCAPFYFIVSKLML